MIKGFRFYVVEVARYLPFAAFMARTETKLRYRRSYFGIVWHVLVPVTQIAVMAAVFKCLIPGRSGTEFVIFLVPGIALWNFISQSLREGAASIIGAGRILHARPVPIVIFPIVKTVSGVSTLPLLLLLVVPFVYFTGVEGSPNIWLGAVGAIIAVTFVCGLAMVCGIVTVFFRDFAAMLEILLSVGFFATPIIYSPEQLPRQLQTLIAFNPLTYFVAMTRAPLIGGAVPSIAVYVVGAIVAVLCVVVASVVGCVSQKKAVYQVE